MALMFQSGYGFPRVVDDRVEELSLEAVASYPYPRYPSDERSVREFKNCKRSFIRAPSASSILEIADCWNIEKKYFISWRKKTIKKSIKILLSRGNVFLSFKRVEIASQISLSLSLSDFASRSQV